MLYLTFFILGSIAHLCALWAERDKSPVLQLICESMTVPILIMFLVGVGIWVPNLFYFVLGAEVGMKVILIFAILTVALILGVCWRLLICAGTLHDEIETLRRENELYKKEASARTNYTPRIVLKKND